MLQWLSRLFVALVAILSPCSTGYLFHQLCRGASFKHNLNRGVRNVIHSARSAQNDAAPFEAKQAEVQDGETPKHVAFRYTNLMDTQTSLERSKAFLKLMNTRRSIRFFDPEHRFPVELLNTCIETAGTAPSGAHQQPWHFAVVQSPALKKEIRALVEKEEQINYDERMKRTWVADLAPLLNDTALYREGVVQKPYLEDAPYIVVLFEQVHGIDPNTGAKLDHYYTKQSVGIAAGLFFSALTNVGLFSLPSTPLNCEAGIRALLGRPANERVYLLMPVGFPAKDATVPYRSPRTVPLRKSMRDITSYH